MGSVVITASQLNREGNINEDAGVTDVAGGFGKVSASDLFIILRQTPKMYHDHLIDMMVGKSRAGQKHMILRCEFDPSSMQIHEISMRRDEGKRRRGERSSNSETNTGEFPF
jgi:hypothetical protein